MAWAGFKCSSPSSITSNLSSGFSSVILPPIPAGVREVAKPGTPVAQREARRKLQRHQQACQQRVASAEEKADVGCSVSGGVVAARHRALHACSTLKCGSSLTSTSPYEISYATGGGGSCWFQMSTQAPPKHQKDKTTSLLVFWSHMGTFRLIRRRMVFIGRV